MTRSPLSRAQLAKKVLVRFVLGFIFLLAVLVLSAGTMDYWEAWAYSAVLAVPAALVFAYLLANDPELLERRLRVKEKYAGQTALVRTGAACYFLTFLLSGLDRRFGWSHVPVAAVVVADVLVLLGYGLFTLVLRENRYASRVVEVEQGQCAVTTGPYAIVRHPMYLAVLVTSLATPVALASWWAVLVASSQIIVLVARIRSEERLLASELDGYEEYAETVKYRLIPGLW